VRAIGLAAVLLILLMAWLRDAALISPEERFKVAMARQ